MNKKVPSELEVAAIKTIQRLVNQTELMTLGEIQRLKVAMASFTKMLEEYISIQLRKKKK